MASSPGTVADGSILTRTSWWGVGALSAAIDRRSPQETVVTLRLASEEAASLIETSRPIHGETEVEDRNHEVPVGGSLT